MDHKVRLFNTYTRNIEQFIPQEGNKVKMYVCGITPYDSVHVGHARCYVVFDTIRRYLEYAGYDVTYIQNFTDIDDKIIERSNKLGVDFRELANKFITEYHEQMARLNIKPAAKYPLVSENIEKIVKFIEKLVLTGAAYAVSNGDVYFAVRKFEKYGKLSNRDIDQLRAGARVETGEVKSDPLDFALWKSAKPGEPSWQSPWGGGRPGWHIECSVMSIGELGTETLDIHGGGLDLVFPHHENETAQSEACTGKTFAKYWVHNGFVTVDKEKMSKSLGNFFSLKDVLAKYEPMVLRMFLLSQHYRTPLDFSDTVLKQTKNAWEGLSDIYELAMFVFHKAGVTSVTELNSVDAAVLAKFEAVMSDDFNSERGLAVVFELKKEIISAVNKRDIQTLKVKVATLKLLIEKVLGLMFSPIVYDFGKVNISLEAQSMLAQREAAKKNKDFTAADIARDGIKKLGFIVEDTPWGQRLKKVL